MDRGRAVDPIIRALAYNEEVGSNTQFVYSQGTFIDVMDLESDYDYQKAFDTQNKEYLDSLNVEMKREADEGFSQEDALKKVNEMLKDLSIKDFTVTDCVKAIGTEDSESWGGGWKMEN